MTYTETIQTIYQINHLLNDPRITKETRAALTTRREYLNQTLK